MSRPCSPSFCIASLAVAGLCGSAALPSQESAALLHAPLVVLPVDSAPFQRLGDFDCDGDPDAVGTRIHQNGGNNQVVVWRNDVGAMVQAFAGTSSIYGFGGNTAGGWRSYAVATGELDGRIDLVVASTPGMAQVGKVLHDVGTLPNGDVDFRIVQQAMSEGRLADLDDDGDADLCARVVARGMGYSGQSGGLRRQVGTGTVGKAGARPVWDAHGPFRDGEVERLVLRGVPGPTIAVLGVSLAGAEQPEFLFPGLTLRLDLATVITETLTISENGQGAAQRARSSRSRSRRDCSSSCSTARSSCSTRRPRTDAPARTRWSSGSATDRTGARRSLLRDREVP